MYLSIAKAAELLNVTPQTLRNWEESGKLLPDIRTKGNQRKYLKTSILPELLKINKKTITYARVSTTGQKQELETQKQLLQLFCASKGFTFEEISDIGSGINYHKKGLNKLIDMILNNQVERLIITHKDRLLRFGSELIFDICKVKEIEIIIINQTDEDSTFEQELVKDVLEIITVFSAKLYGSRSHKNKKLIQDIENILKENQ